MVKWQINLFECIPNGFEEFFVEIAVNLVVEHTHSAYGYEPVAYFGVCVFVLAKKYLRIESNNRRE